MRLYYLILIPILLNSCEELIYGKYKIIDKEVYLKQNVSENIYTVKEGENLYLIAKKKNISLRRLIQINKISYPYKIYKNQKIIIPKLLVHRVKKGETLYSISRKYNVDQYNLSKINKIPNNNIIYVNQELQIPQRLKKVAPSNNKKKKIIKNLSLTSPRFIWPVKGEIILKFGRIKPGFHNDGINIVSNVTKDVVASESGSIIYTGNEIPGYGNLVLIKHKKNWITAYSHLDMILLPKGSKVYKGQKIGTIGLTGNVNKPQLHFEIRKGKKAYNPENFLS